MPAITVVIPCYNEQNTIHLLLDALYRQTFPRSNFEVVIADGMSSDQTRAVISSYQQEHPELHLRIVDNPRRSIPSGVNQAIHAARGEWIVRLDAHSVPYPDYLERCFGALQARKGDNVGGQWEIQPGKPGWLAQSIAAAAAHPLGVGDAHYRVGGQAQAVDTVPFGSFHRTLVERIGYYDEQLLSNEDYEFNARIRQSGGTIWFDPGIRSVYFARGDLLALARQYGRYGYWKVHMLRRYPKTLRWRQILPPVFVLALLSGGILSLVHPLFSWLFGVGVLLYGVILLAAGLSAAFRERQASLAIGIPLAIATMHLAWGSAFLWSLVGLGYRWKG